jgi:hypothetical protein
MGYANLRARERQGNHEQLKSLARLLAWMNHYKVASRTAAHEQAINTWCELAIKATIQEIRP